MFALLRLPSVRPVYRATIASVFAGVISQAVLILSGPLVARSLGVEGRGYLALLVLFATFLAQLGSLGLPQALTYYIAADPPRAKRVVWSAMWTVAIQVIVLVVAHALLLLIYVGDKPDEVLLAALLTLGAIPVSLANQYGLAILQGQKRFGAYNSLRLLEPILYVAGMVAIFVVGLHQLPIVASAWVVSYLGAAVVTGMAALKGLPPSDTNGEIPSVKEMLHFGLKGLLGSASPLASFRLDQAVVGLFLSPAALGIYVVGQAFTNLPYFIASSVGVVAYPYVAGQSDRSDARRSMWRFFWLTIPMCVIIVAVLEISAGWLVPFFFGEEFGPAITITRIALLGAVFISARRVLMDGARGAGHPALGTVSEVVAWLALLLGLLLLAPQYGVTGVTIAMVASSALGLTFLAAALLLTHRGGRNVTKPSASAGEVGVA